MLSEFDIINNIFRQPGLAAEPGASVRLGIGDDCALLAVPDGMDMAVSMDSLVEGVHFPPGAPADLLGYRALMVNLSDLAAMGATPAGFTLALTLPTADDTWLRAFGAGLKAGAQQYQCPLIGGNIARGPLNITIQVHGLVASGHAITRTGARDGDRIYVSGHLGASALAIRRLMTIKDADPERRRSESAFYKPVPRLALGAAVTGLVTAGLDISDGLVADLAHLCAQSDVAGQVDLEAVPMAPALHSLPAEEARKLALTGGEDYELILTVSPAQEAAFVAAARALDLPVHAIGDIVQGAGVTCLDSAGHPVAMADTGWRHF